MSNDNTRFVQMVHPDGGITPIPVSPRHNGGRSVEFYRAKGFKTLDEHEAEQATAKKIADLEAKLAESEGKKRKTQGD